MYQIELAKNQQEWTSFLEQQVKTASFLQSWQWGEQRNDTVRIVIKNDNNQVVFICLMFPEKILANKNHYLYAPFGPIWLETLNSNEKKSVLNYFFEKLESVINIKNPAFILFDNNLEDNQENQNIFENCINSPLRLQVGASFIIPINGSEEEILAKMHTKTRYNIRLAEKKGVEILWDQSGQYFDEWFIIMKSTAERNKIRLLSKNHYKKLLDKKILTLILAKFENKIIAGNLLSLIPPTAVYVHGGMDYQHHNLMAPFLLQWQSILEAKKQGCQRFDFWGVNYQNKNPQWAGITRFKLGFNEEEKVIAYLPSKVKIYKKTAYYYTLLLHYLRKIKKFVLTR